MLARSDRVETRFHPQGDYTRPRKWLNSAHLRGILPENTLEGILTAYRSRGSANDSLERRHLGGGFR